MPAAAAPASDLERRKLLRLRLRADLAIEAQKYEGKTFYVLKDPVSLRYYRLKENEHYLLQFLDGKRTLEDAQKSYEKQYRPERLRLEDLEAFAQQLLNAGLAHNDSPRAGQQLFEQRRKRKRRELMQTLTNILYIKIPVIDPDRLLRRMLHYLSFIFSVWFNLLAISLMLAAIMLVATHFDIFRSKLPDYHEFFSFKTVVYLWCALGVVKVIHEFGHGLSCRHFGGEVHEMGFLLLCLSPALYCNVSDSWTLPNKWHRIIISFAGIYVELIIAALSTFIWWYTPSQPFINNMALSLMVVCSVSTVVFNANPLMRYDGYYVLADWLEIPNLREKSNRFLMNLVMDKCLGIEVQPEAYMAIGRRVLFVGYALISYIYRWVVTFAILYFMYSFLRPYKLEVISSMLALGALASMTGWPLYNLGKNLYRRGRLPDMKKKARVLVTTAAVVAVILFVFLVPVPINRIRCSGLVQYHPESSAKVFLTYPGILAELKVRDGDAVKAGDELAVFSNRELDSKLSAAQTEMENQQKKLDILARQRQRTSDLQEQGKIFSDISKTVSEYEKASTEVKTYLKIKMEVLILRAPRAGVVNGCPRIEDIGKHFELDPKQPFCDLGEPDQLRICLPVVTSEFNQLKENVERLSPAALRAHRYLQRRVTVSFDQTRLMDVLHKLESQVAGARIWVDMESLKEKSVEKVSDVAVTYQAGKRKLAAVLDEVLGRLGLGYVVVSDPGQPQHDGWIVVRASRERGMPEGPRKVPNLAVYIRIQGRDATVWNGRLLPLPESEAKEIPLALSSKAGGPVAVKATPTKEQTLVPQTQHYLVYVDVINPDVAITPGTMAQVKIYCQPETCARWVWRQINNLFDLGLM